MGLERGHGTREQTMVSPADILNAAILVVDDEAASLTVLEQTLRGAGYLFEHHAS